MPKPDYPPLTPDDKMPFGKHEGVPVWSVIKHDPRYVDWLLENTDVEFDNEAFEMYQERKERGLI